MTFRTLLFVPGARPDRFSKARAAGPDAVCIDLEDAVPPHQKDQARGQAMAFLQADASSRFGLRINGVTTAPFAADCEALRTAPTSADFVMVPKLETAEQVALVRERIGKDCPPVWPVIESPEGLRNAWDIAAASGVGGVLFGGADYSAEIGSDMEWDALAFARGQLVAACARGGVELLDVPYLDIKDPEGLVTTTTRVKAMGFTGRSCIHPDQVTPVNTVFTSTPDAVAHARRVMEAFEAAEGGAVQLDGKLIDLPVIRTAQRTLERAGGA